MLSTSDVILTGSTVLGLETVTVKVKVPPGAGSDSGTPPW